MKEKNQEEKKEFDDKKKINKEENQRKVIEEKNDKKELKSIPMEKILFVEFPCEPRFQEGKKVFVWNDIIPILQRPCGKFEDFVVLFILIFFLL
jgi:hypothetical protein